jgi:prepilin-type N-terminal cleavage/methylation domain-containing protein
MSQRKKAFTLIELIIVVVIIGILALIAIPKYYASVGKAKKSQVYTNLDAIRQALLSYYAVYGVYPAPGTWPIQVIVDGDTVVSMGNPTNAAWYYNYNNDTNSCTPPPWIFAETRPIYTCQYGLCIDGQIPCRNCCTP